MGRWTSSRRGVLRRMLAAVAAAGALRRRRAEAAGGELALPAGTPEQRIDFESGGIDGWTVLDGQWAVEEMAGAPSATAAALATTARLT